MTIPSKPPGYYTDKLFTCDDMDKAIQKEREECAKVAENISSYDRDEPEVSIAKAIRARGQE